jgi:hypothetical protein
VDKAEKTLSFLLGWMTKPKQHLHQAKNPRKITTIHSKPNRKQKMLTHDVSLLQEVTSLGS